MDRGRPTKKIFFLLIACTLAVGSIGWATYSTKAGLKKPESLTVSDRPKTAELADSAARQKIQQDPDLDGLADWEEVLWETDSGNPDTDRDGTNDGEEVKLGRNPKIAGPNDKIAASASNVIDPAVAKQIKLDNTQTGKIGRDLFASYLEAKKLGLPLEANIQTKIIDQALHNKTLSIAPKQYSVSEIVVSTSVDLKEYGNNVGRAMYSGAVKDTVSELDIVQTALQKERPEELQKLDRIISAYTQVVASLLSTPAPQKYTTIHLSLINDTNNILADIKSFKEVFNDPVIGLAGIGKYYQDIDRLKNSMKLMRTVFETNGVVFESTEYGALFSKIN